MEPQNPWQRKKKRPPKSKENRKRKKSKEILNIAVPLNRVSEESAKFETKLPNFSPKSSPKFAPKCNYFQ